MRVGASLTSIEAVRRRFDGKPLNRSPFVLNLSKHGPQSRPKPMNLQGFAIALRQAQVEWPT
jgi:hypothetical protein